jgi:aspartate/tyrosine/aromatic aminotransferase
MPLTTVRAIVSSLVARAAWSRNCSMVSRMKTLRESSRGILRRGGRTDFSWSHHRGMFSLAASTAAIVELRSKHHVYVPRRAHQHAGGSHQRRPRGDSIVAVMG